jgi:hypothetical protein
MQECHPLRKSSLLVVLLASCFGNALAAQTAESPNSSPAGAPQVLTTVAQIRALSDGLVAKALPVELHAIITYYKPGEGQVFVQDSTGGIYVLVQPNPPALHAGDAVVIRGVTVPSYSPNVSATDIRFDHHAQFPKPVPVTWREILQKAADCRYVSIVGIVRAATLQVPSGQSSEQPYLLIDLQTQGGLLRLHVEDPLGTDPIRLLDSQVRVEGVAGGVFDGKFQQIGAEMWISSAQHIQVLQPAASDPTKLPLTAINRIMAGYFAQDLSQRVHVRGSLTLYQPGLQMVLETPERQAVLVSSYEQSTLHMGQVVDVVGFPDPHQYSEMLTDASVMPTAETQVIQPVPVLWTDALAGRTPFELVSMEGKLAAEVHERHQDTLIIQTGAHVFSAILPRSVWDRDVQELALPDYRVGSTVRIVGVCIVHAGGPWNTERWFDLQMRSPQDVAVLVAPPWWTVRRLLSLSAALLSLMVAVLFWAMMLQRKVRKQTEQIRLTMESEAARERRIAFLEKERGRVLEAINSMLKLDDVLHMIVRLISTQLEDRSCWCELANGTLLGEPAVAPDFDHVVRRGIYSGAGERLGSLVVSGAEAYQEQAGEALEMGASLAALAIDNRRLYETLIHRSQYDQLTKLNERAVLRVAPSIENSALQSCDGLRRCFFRAEFAFPLRYHC